MPLKVVDIRDDHARALYQRDLVLVRPDHHVAWRGDTVPDRPDTVIDRVRGAAPMLPVPAAQGGSTRRASRLAHRLWRRNAPEPRPHLVDSTD
jgi:hypothetical protein